MKSEYMLVENYLSTGFVFQVAVANNLTVQMNAFA